RKQLEQLTPMKVAYHAPPVTEDALADSAPEAVPNSKADARIELAAQVAPAEQTTPAAQPVAKTRKRRAAAAADHIAIEGAEAPADGAMAVKSRKRRTPAASAERTTETEP